MHLSKRPGTRGCPWDLEENWLRLRRETGTGGREAWKASGGKVDYRTFAGLSHSGVVTDAAVKNAVSAWIKARLG